MSEKDNIPRVIVIQRVGKRMTLSKQAEKDRVLTSERMRRNEACLGFVRKRLQLFSPNLQKKELDVVAQAVPGVSLDRLAKRSRDCLICWFCENWIAIEPHLPGLCIQQPRVSESDSRNSCACTAEGSPAPVADDFDSNTFGFGEFELPFETEGAFAFFDVLE
jgi:hypothetical protein